MATDGPVFTSPSTIPPEVLGHGLLDDHIAVRRILARNVIVVSAEIAEAGNAIIQAGDNIISKEGVEAAYPLSAHLTVLHRAAPQIDAVFVDALHADHTVADGAVFQGIRSGYPDHGVHVTGMGRAAAHPFAVDDNVLQHQRSIVVPLS